MELICRRYVEHDRTRYEIRVWRHNSGFVATWTCPECSQSSDVQLSCSDIECAVRHSKNVILNHHLLVHDDWSVVLPIGMAGRSRG
jgi:hypothetical protein